MLTLKKITVFLTIIDQEFNFSKASKYLKTSQPAISREIQSLEKDMKSQIFQRSGKKITGLTPLGKLIKKQFTLIEISKQNIYDISSNYLNDSKNKKIKIGTTHTQSCYFFPKVLKQFKTIFPDIIISIEQHSHEELLNLINKMQIDFAFFSSNEHLFPKIFQYEACYSWEPIVIFPPNHPLNLKKNINIQDLQPYPIATYSEGLDIYEMLQKASKNEEIPLHFILQTNNTSAIKEYVKEGVSIGIINNIALSESEKKEIYSKKIFKHSKMVANLVTIKNRVYPKYIENIFEIIRSHAQNMNK